MALSSEMSAADIAAVTGNGNNGFGFGGDGTWLLILFLFAFMNNGWGGNGGYGGNGILPWAYAQNTDNLVQSGFNQAATTSILGDLSGAITNGFANAEVSRCNQMANITNILNNMASNQQSCCCENRLAISNLSADIAREACADRAAVSDGVRDILASVQNQTTQILNQMCMDKIDAKNEKISELQTQLNMAALRESQTAQTAQLLANNEAQTAALERYLAPTPVPAYQVPAPWSTYNYGYGCGCGMA